MKVTPAPPSDDLVGDPRDLDHLRRPRARARCGPPRGWRRPPSPRCPSPRLRRHVAERARQERLPRAAHEDRTVERGELRQACQRVVAVLGPLGEPEAGVDDHRLAGDAGPLGRGHALRQLVAHLARRRRRTTASRYMSRGRPAHVHQRPAPAPAAATTAPRPGSYLRPEISFTMAAPSSSAALGDGGLGGVDRDRQARRADDRGAGPGSRRRSSSSASTAAAPGRVDSAPRSRMSAPCASASCARSSARPGSTERLLLGKGIGREVDDRHHQRALAELEAAPAGEGHGVASACVQGRRASPRDGTRRRPPSVRRRLFLRHGFLDGLKRSAPSSARVALPRARLVVGRRRWPPAAAARPPPACRRRRAGAPARRRALRGSRSASAMRVSASRCSASIA